MWLSLHVLGLAMLWLSTSWPMGWPFIVVICVTAVFYVGASFSDPGFVDITPPSGVLDAALLQDPICQHCQAPQPKRAKHCFTCGRCVHRLDHHCLWLGNCVGENNHRLFVAYLLAQGVLLGWAAWASAVALVTGEAVEDLDSGGSGGSTVVRRPLTLLSSLSALGCCGLSLLLFLAVATLFGFQVMLVLRGETTWENLRRSKINAAAQLPLELRPYDRGPWSNVILFCQCAPDPTSAMRRRIVLPPPTEEGWVT